MDTLKPNVLVIDRSGYKFFVDRSGEPIISPARYNVFFMTKPVHVPTVRLADLSGLLVIDTEDAKAIGELTRSLHAIAPLHRIVALAERHLEVVAALREELHIPGMSVAETLPFRDKLLMKERVAAAGVRVPEFHSLRSPLDAEPLLRKHRKIIIKPVAGMGTKDTFGISSLDELQHLAARDDLAFDQFEAEEFIEGPMYHVDGIVAGGEVLVATPFRYTDSDLEYEKCDWIADIQETNPTLVARMLDQHERVVKALGLEAGTTHLECFLTPSDELVFCEVAARPGGWAMMDMFEALHGLDLRRIAIEFQLGLGFSGVSRARVGCVGEIVFYPRPGRVERVSTPREFSDDWIHHVRIKPAAGDTLKRPIMSGDVAAAFVVTGDTEVEVTDRLAAVRARFVLEVVDVPTSG
jgi:biotin carboxylase